MLEITKFLGKKPLKFLIILVKTCGPKITCNCFWWVYIIFSLFIYFNISSGMENKDLF